MPDAFAAPDHDPSHHPVPLPGLEGRITVTLPGLVTGQKLHVDGRPAPKGSKWGTFALPDGRDATLSGGFTRTLPTVTVDGQAHELGEAIPIPLVVLQFLPIGLVGLGGLLGGIAGGLGVGANMAINRQGWSMPVKAGAMLAVAGVSFVGWLAFATGLTLLLQG